MPDADWLVPPETRLSMPGAPASVARMIDGPARETPDKIALIGRHARLSYAELDQKADAAVALLIELGVKPGDRVAATAANGADLITAFLACQRIGAIWVGINRNYAPAEKRYFLEDSGASLYLGDRDAIAQTAAAGIVALEMEPGDEQCAWAQALARHAGHTRPAVGLDPWAPAAIAYTSGTTGRPKGAVHSQHNMIVAATMSQVMSQDDSDQVVRGMTSPMTILNMMILGAIATLSRGDRLVCMDRTDSRGVADWIREERITTTNLVPTIVYDLLTRPDIPAEDLASLRWLVVGGAMVPEGLPRLYEERFGTRMTTGYGQTELPTTISRTHEYSATVQGAVGRPLPHLEVAIRDEDDCELPAGTAGEICLRAARSGPFAGVYTPMLGYWNRAEATRNTIRNGWLRTGDIGHLAEDGDLFVHDRRSDVIIRGGANVYPAEIERVLRTVPGVSDCAVIGLPDQRLGQSIAAVIEAAPAQGEDALIAELDARCEEEVARYKRPVAWRVVESLPRNAGGKIVKAELRNLFG
ncbi:class I adenylate-forming enzyme family protein [Sphingobium sp. TKS]|uniref:class I adenylate-forming enzyme family protein n=1 Tax=Sphingobium sp. TKS TaxID=1315974 RepID=UPI00077033B2|nr:AMP-binding protein [Sphingobium sp. TKS]AMK25585.1 AMP-dependent synthetase and ligase [Sphingobium sp. TKS]